MEVYRLPSGNCIFCVLGRFHPLRTAARSPPLTGQTRFQGCLFLRWFFLDRLGRTSRLFDARGLLGSSCSWGLRPGVFALRLSLLGHISSLSPRSASDCLEKIGRGFHTSCCDLNQSRGSSATDKTLPFQTIERRVPRSNRRGTSVAFSVHCGSKRRLWLMKAMTLKPLAFPRKPPPPLPELIDSKAAKSAGHPLEKDSFFERDRVRGVQFFQFSARRQANHGRCEL